MLQRSSFALLPRPKATGSPFQIGLAPASNADGVFGHILGNHRTGTNDGSSSNNHRGNKGRIGADEGLRANGGLVFIEPIVVARNGACADVGPLTYGRIPQVAQVAGLRAGPKTGLLHFHKVTNLGTGADQRALAKPGIRTNGCAFFDLSGL